jgi:hypothetical protein
MCELIQLKAQKKNKIMKHLHNKHMYIFGLIVYFNIKVSDLIIPGYKYMYIIIFAYT